MAKILKVNNVSEVIAFTDIAAYYLFFSLIFYNKFKKYIWFHNSYFQHINLVTRLTRRYVYPYFNKLIVLNKMDTAIYQKIYGKHKAIMIPNPLSFELDNVSSLTSKKIISIGRLAKEKGFEYLINAAKIIFKKHPDWSLDIIGQDMGEGYHLKKMIEDNKLMNHVQIKNATKNVQNLYLNSSIFVMTSHFECLPLVLIEAAEAGLPLVAFNSPSGISDIIIDKQNGFLAQKLNTEELAKKMMQLISSYELRKKFGNQSKIQNKQFKLNVILDKWITLLK